MRKYRGISYHYVMRDIPSKTALLERREELTLVSEGKSVLEERRDILARQLLDLIKLCETLADAFERRQQRAWQALQYVIIRHGSTALLGFQIPGLSHNLDWKMRNRVGVAWLEASKLPEPSSPLIPPSWRNSPELKTAIIAFSELQATAFELAQTENNLQRMSRAFKAVQQRVNALEHIVLPETIEAIKFIEEGLEQIDREQMVGVLWLKRQEGAG